MCEASATPSGLEQLLAIMNAGAGGLMFQIDGSGVPVMNDAARRLLDLDAGTPALAGHLAHLRWLQADGTPCGWEDLPHAVTRRSGHPAATVTAGRRRPDGHVQWLRFDAARWQPQAGRFRGGVVTTFSDVTPLVDLTRQRHAQTFESVRRVAGGVAHTFNNLLTIIIGHAALALDERPRHPGLADALEEILRASYRAADLTRQLGAYCGQRPAMRRLVNIDELAGQARAMALAATSRPIAVECDLAGGIVAGDPVQIRQALSNLAVNACEAVEDHSAAVVIRTRVREVDGDELQSSCLPGALSPGRYVVIEVADTGLGIPDDVLPRIFDPFFSTKFTGRGLGLAEVLGVVRGHGGTLTARSTVGSGTTIRVFLPEAATTHG